jgi:hypothetical protein
MDIRELFEKFTRPEYFSRIDNNHILELHIGLDDKCRKSIELRSKFKPSHIMGTATIEVGQFVKPEYNTIRFSLKTDSMKGLFYVFCQDLIDQTRDLSNESLGYKAITDRYHQWKRLFVSSKKELLTEPQIMGLIGELLFLKGDLAKKFGLSKALYSWSGQKLTHKDFSLDDTWFEVKTIGTGQQNIKISSLEQLDSNNCGEIIVIFIEKMSPTYRGISLNKLVLEVANLFDTLEDRDLFYSKVSLQGYEYNDYYDEYVFEKKDIVHYQVNDQFPKLTPKGLPHGIIKASYEIALSDISEFIVK